MGYNVKLHIYLESIKKFLSEGSIENMKLLVLLCLLLAGDMQKIRTFTR